MTSGVWESFAHDPRDPAYAALRASDADRDVINSLLGEAFADGRLDRAEFDERAASVQTARTLGELPAFVADLVPAWESTGRAPVPLARSSSRDLARRAEAKFLEKRRNALFGFLGPTVICWIVWISVNWDQSNGGLQTDAFPWPAIVMVVTLLNLIKVSVSRQQIVDEELRRLERKRAKELGPSGDS